jgi:hypothetical protein
MIFLLITQKSHQIETITISFLGYCAIWNYKAMKYVTMKSNFTVWGKMNIQA